MDRSQYDFVGAHQVPPARQWGLLLLLAALATLLALREFPYWLVPLGLALIGVYFFARPPRRDYFVELDDEQLVVHLLTETHISYKDISSVSFHQTRYNRSIRIPLNALIAFSNLFGAGVQKIAEPQEGVFSGVSVGDSNHGFWLSFHSLHSYSHDVRGYFA